MTKQPSKLLSTAQTAQTKNPAARVPFVARVAPDAKANREQMHTAISRLDNALIERAVSEPETPEHELVSWRAKMAMTLKTNLPSKKAGRR